MNKELAKRVYLLLSSIEFSANDPNPECPCCGASELNGAWRTRSRARHEEGCELEAVMDAAYEAAGGDAAFAAPLQDPR